MRVPCETCEGHGSVISRHSLRQGHTHGNDPDREDVECGNCGGAGDRPATPSDLDGEHVRYQHITGYVTWERRNDTLTLSCENTQIEVVNLEPGDLEAVP